MRGTLPLAFLLIVGLTIPAIPQVGAHSDGLYLVLTTDSEEYSVGDEVHVTVHSFHSGEYVDLDEPPVVVLVIEDYGQEVKMLQEDEDGIRNLTSDRIDKGRYKAVFKIMEGDVQTEGYTHIGLEVLGETKNGDRYVVSYGRSSKNDTTFDHLSEEDVDEVIVDLIGPGGPKGLSIEYEISDLSRCPWGPGDKIPFTFRVTENGSPVAPDQLRVDLEWMDVSGTDGSDPIGYVNRSMGVFDAEVIVPLSIDVSGGASVRIYSIKGMEDTTLSFYLSLETYQVWVHWLPSTNRTTRVFDIYVSDPEGRVVPGAVVGFETYDRSSSDRTYSSVTDMEGKATFTVEGVTDSIWFEGWFIVGENNISFDGVINPLVEEGQEGPIEEPNGYGFDVIVSDMKGSKLDLYAFMDGEPLVSSDIDHYASTGRAVKSHGWTTTDDKGWFQMDLGSSDDRYYYLHFMFSTGYHPGLFVGYNWSDGDEDGFSDQFEEEIGTGPDDPEDFPHGYVDSDEDGFGDDYEVWFGSDPEDPYEAPSTYNDTDRDGWGDEFEVSNGTDPMSVSERPGQFMDTDNDDHDDDEEVFYGKEPDDPSDHPEDRCALNSDGDSVGYRYGWREDEQYDVEEVFYGTDPEDPDDFPFDRFANHSDYDGVCDEEELFYGTDPEDSADDPNYVPYPWDERYSDHNSTDGFWYDTDYDYHYSSGVPDLGNKDTTITVDRLTVGGRTTITLTSSKEPAGFLCAVIPGNLEVLSSLVDGGDIEWEPLMSGNNVVPVYRTKDGWKGVIILPGFLPKGDQEYTILAGAATEEDSLSFAYVTLKDGESGSSGERDNDGKTWLIYVGAAIVLALVLLMIVAVLVLIVSRKRTDRPEVPKEGTTEEGPSMDETLASIPDAGKGTPTPPAQQPAQVVRSIPGPTVGGPMDDPAASQPHVQVQSVQATVASPPEDGPPAVEVVPPPQEVSPPQTNVEGPGVISLGPDIDMVQKKEGTIDLDDLLSN